MMLHFHKRPGVCVIESVCLLMLFKFFVFQIDLQPNSFTPSQISPDSQCPSVAAVPSAVVAPQSAVAGWFIAAVGLCIAAAPLVAPRVVRRTSAFIAVVTALAPLLMTTTTKHEHPRPMPSPPVVVVEEEDNNELPDIILAPGPLDNSLSCLLPTEIEDEREWIEVAAHTCPVPPL